MFEGVLCCGLFWVIFKIFLFSQRGTGCTTDCVGNSCESILNLEGACFVPSVNSSSDCSGYATRNTVTSEWYDDECVLNLVSSQAECSAVHSQLSSLSSFFSSHLLTPPAPFY